ncbi:MAG: IS3 family transposase [Gammaproteobacteria bacterium]|nr:IS3 family transposase [Gammaproteobacteria bacterium]
MKYASIKKHREIFPVSRQCAVLGVSRSGYYEWLGRPESARRREERRLGERAKEIHADSRKTYGARRIQQVLIAEGETLSRARTRRLMKKQGLESMGRRKFKATTNSNHSRPVAPNLLNREFEVGRPNTVYAGDITYIPTQESLSFSSRLLSSQYSRYMASPNEAVEKLSEMPRRRKSVDSKTPPWGEISEYRASQEVEIFPRS